MMDFFVCTENSAENSAVFISNGMFEMNYWHCSVYKYIQYARGHRLVPGCHYKLLAIW